MAIFARRSSGDPVRDLREQLQTERWQTELLTENMRRLELAMADEGWQRLTVEMDREFTRSGLDDLMKISRAMYLSHPLIQRAVNVRAYYTWAQGVAFHAEEDRVQAELIDLMTENLDNRAELYSHQARILTDTDQSIDGNVFYALLTDQTTGMVEPISVPAEEVRDIHYSPNDKRRPWFYRRCWNEERFSLDTGLSTTVQREVLYPDWRYQPDSRPGTIGRTEVRWDAPIIHQRTGGLKAMRFGIPETYAALDWARAYRRFLEDWHTIVASLSRFAWKATTKGSKVGSVKKRLASTISSDEPVETNAPPVAGSVAVMSGADDLVPIPKTGATTSAEDGKPARLMVASAMDLPDTILSGDPQQGNLATAKTLDRPTELAIRSRQSMWADFDKSVFGYSLDQLIIRGKLPGRTVRTADGRVVESTLDPSIAVNFPPILEHDVQQTVTAIISAATLDGKVEAGIVPRGELSKLLLSAIGVDDVEAAVEQLDDEQQDALAQAVERLAEAVVNGG